MIDQTFDELQNIHQSQGPAGAIDHLIAFLRTEKRHHALFDALLMKKRLEMGLGLVRPAAMKDVPEEQRDDFEKVYVDAAREVGQLLLEDNSIAQAWTYFRAINEPQPVVSAITAIPEEGSMADEIIEIALFQGVAPVKGLAMYLASHGTCSTITAFDQISLQIAPEARRQCVQTLVRKLFDDLRENVEHDIMRRQPTNPPGQSLRELIAGRDWLFADDSYHLDVSHLNAVVRFARFLDATCPELDLALQLAQYGARLAPQYQYAGNAPFDEFYPAHIQYFKALLDDDRETAIGYFRSKIGEDASDTDNQVAAFALVDLLQRLERPTEAVELACRYLASSADQFGISLPEMCVAAGRFDLLLNLSRSQEDVVNYTAALIGNHKS